MNHFLAKFKYWIESDWVSDTTTVLNLAVFAYYMLCSLSMFHNSCKKMRLTRTRRWRPSGCSRHETIGHTEKPTKQNSICNICPNILKKCSPAKLSMKISPQDFFILISNCSNYLILDNSYKLELVIMMRHHDLPFVADFDQWYTTKGESWPWISSFRSFVDAAEVMMVRPPTIWRLVRLRKRWYNIVLYKNFGEMWLALSLRKISNEKLRLRAWNWRLPCLFNL